MAHRQQNYYKQWHQKKADIGEVSINIDAHFEVNIIIASISLLNLAEPDRIVVNADYGKV